jgi:uracil-DNA glycosylase family 4
VDAKEKLRRYLEQRRELGETELALDGLTVDDALRILGANAGAQSARPPVATAPKQGAPMPRATETADAPDIADWRDALRQAGASPDTMAAKKPSVVEPRPTTREAAASPAASSKPTPPAPQAPTETIAISDIPAGLSVGTAAGELFGGEMGTLRTLEEIAAHVASCTRCPLYSTATNPVPGEGSATADFMCVGEAPGATEDETGRPFVGAAGQLLTKILAAIELRREDVYIVNVLKHRPPGNRNPRPEEVQACSPYLIRQIELIRPKVILALGTFAAQTLLETKLSIGKLRNQIHRYYGVPLIVTYHPAALLRNPSWKRPAWEDVKLARRILDNSPPTSAGA